MRGLHRASFFPYFLHRSANNVSNNTSFRTLGNREPHKIHVLQSVTIDICRKRCFYCTLPIVTARWFMAYVRESLAINPLSHLQRLYCKEHALGDSLSFRCEREVLDRFGRGLDGVVIACSGPRTAWTIDCLYVSNKELTAYIKGIIILSASFRNLCSWVA